MHEEMRTVLPCEIGPREWARGLTGDDVGQALDAIHAFKVLLPRWEEHLVFRARAQRWWWEMIAAKLGVSEQAVYQRWRARVEMGGGRARPSGLCCKIQCIGDHARWRYPRRHSRAARQLRAAQEPLNPD